MLISEPGLLLQPSERFRAGPPFAELNLTSVKMPMKSPENEQGTW